MSPGGEVLLERSSSRSQLGGLLRLAHYPELAALDGLEQEPDWHPEGDVFTHSGLAAQVAADVAGEAGLVGDDRYVVVAAPLLHDGGKATTTRRQVDAVVVERIVSHATPKPAPPQPGRSSLPSVARSTSGAG